MTKSTKFVPVHRVVITEDSEYEYQPLPTPKPERKTKAEDLLPLLKKYPPSGKVRDA